MENIINEEFVSLELHELYNKLSNLDKILRELIKENNELKNENILLKQKIDKYKKIPNKTSDVNNPEKIWCVYKHTNKTNGKVYIGITSASTLNQRWDNGNGYILNKPFFEDIQKYGWIEGFYHIVLEDNLTKKEAEKLEKQLIRKYKSQNKDFGYNLASETSASNNAVRVRQYDLNWNFIREYPSISEAVKMNKKVYGNQIRACCREERESAGGYRWKFADETYLLEKHETDRDTEVFQYSLEGKFIRSYKNAIEASINTDVKSRSIHDCCKNRVTSAGGFQWFYEFKGDIIEPSKFYNNTYRRKTPIDMFDKNMNFIKHYDSIQNAVQDLRDNFNIKNAQEGNIRNNLRGSNKTAYGFVFKYPNNV